MSEDSKPQYDTTPSPVVLFDGVCKLCNDSVKFILQRDSKGRLKLASLQSDYGRAILEKHGKSSDPMDSIMLLEGDRLTAKSTAIIRISKYLDGMWPLCMITLVIPRFIRDFLYDIIAKNRYRWFGKYETCRLPDPEFEDRFFT
ncbi:MAG TPA: thiol-disulfide oxidoreductase DCC family protein [Desulfobacteria bacterium]|nr:thiol-disulfide oxidoreductase DCC family protein [Desulfobacteria bacterium]